MIVVQNADVVEFAFSGFAENGLKRRRQPVSSRTLGQINPADANSQRRMTRLVDGIKVMETKVPTCSNS